MSALPCSGRNRTSSAENCHSCIFAMQDRGTKLRGPTMPSTTDVIGALRGLAGNSRREECFAVLGAYAKQEFESLRTGTKSGAGFVSLIGRMEPSDALSLLNETGSLGVWVALASKAADPGRILQGSEAAQHHRNAIAINSTMERAIAELAIAIGRAWPDRANTNAGVRRENVITGMVSLLSCARDFGRTDMAELERELVLKLYPAGLSAAEARMVDDVVTRLYAKQAVPGPSGPPFADAAEASEFRRMLVKYRPSLDHSVTVAMGTAIAAAANIGPSGPLGGTERLRVWRDESGRVSRNPFDGPALFRHGGDGSPREIYLWQGRELCRNSTLHSPNEAWDAAVEALKEISPRDYDTCASDFAERCLRENIDTETLPPALREALEAYRPVSVAA
jgi:hypothetical protein